MTYYPQPDNPLPDVHFPGETSTDAEVRTLGQVPIPAGFCGYVDLHAVARVLQASPAAESAWMTTLRTFCSKGLDGTPITVLGTGSPPGNIPVAGTSFIESANWILSCKLVPSTDFPGMFDVIAKGRVGATVHFDAKVSFGTGRVPGGDG